MKKIFVILLTLLALTINVSAEAFLDPLVQIPDYFVGRAHRPVNGFLELGIMWREDPSGSVQSGNNNSFAGTKVSTIQPNTFYRFSFAIQSANFPTDANMESGTIKVGGDINLKLIPQTGYEETHVNGNMESLRFYAFEEERFNSYRIPDEYVTCYWDHTLDTCYVLFYIPEEYYNEHIAQMMQTTLLFFVGSVYVTGAPQRISFTKITRAEIDDPIYNVLQEIKNNLASSGGGLSEEDIKNAVEDALNDHDEGLIDKVEEALQDFADQITNTFGSAIASTENIKNSLSNFSKVFAYTGTDCVITFPEARNPMTNNSLLWEAQNVDIGQYYNQFPSALTNALRIVLDCLVAFAVVNEVISVISLVTFGGNKDG